MLWFAIFSCIGSWGNTYRARVLVVGSRVVDRAGVAGPWRSWGILVVSVVIPVRHLLRRKRVANAASVVPDVFVGFETCSQIYRPLRAGFDDFKNAASIRLVGEEGTPAKSR